MNASQHFNKSVLSCYFWSIFLHLKTDILLCRRLGILFCHILLHINCSMLRAFRPIRLQNENNSNRLFTFLVRIFRRRRSCWNFCFMSSFSACRIVFFQNAFKDFPNIRSSSNCMRSAREYVAWKNTVIWSSQSSPKNFFQFSVRL